MRNNPKDNITELRLKKGYTGNHERFVNQLDSFENNVTLPKPVEYEDIDEAFLKFVEEKIPMTANGKVVPTYTLFSNQRFSEFSQMYGHTDEEGNLLMDFKTINRANNPKNGTGQGGYYCIPGDRRYTVCVKSVLGDNGTEHYEVHSMGQPMAIDLEYTVSYITADFEKLNDFNLKVNNLFRSYQCYIKPNGYWMPLYLNDIGDQSEYSIDNRKVFVQAVNIVLKGYIIPKSSLKIENFPKRKLVSTPIDMGHIKPSVEVEDMEGRECRIEIGFHTGSVKTEFEFDDYVRLNSVESENVRSFEIKINGEKIIDITKGCLISEDDDVFIRIVPVDEQYPAKLTLICHYTREDQEP